MALYDLKAMLWPRRRLFIRAGRQTPDQELAVRNRATADAGRWRLYADRRKGEWAAGIYNAVEVDRRLVFRWQDAGTPGATQIDVSFEGDGGTHLTFTHSGFAAATMGEVPPGARNPVDGNARKSEGYGGDRRRRAVPAPSADRPESVSDQRRVRRRERSAVRQGHPSDGDLRRDFRSARGSSAGDSRVDGW